MGFSRLIYLKHNQAKLEEDTVFFLLICYVALTLHAFLHSQNLQITYTEHVWWQIQKRSFKQDRGGPQMLTIRNQAAWSALARWTWKMIFWLERF